MEKKSDLAIVLPVYNPFPSWDVFLEKSLHKLFGFFKGYVVDIIIVNDGSTISIENEIKVLQHKFPNIQYISNPVNKGKGFAVRTGLEKANATSFIYTDWDFPFGEKSVFETFKVIIDSKASLVIGKRTQEYFKSLPKVRRIISKSLRMINVFYFGLQKIDTQAELKGLDESARALFLRTKTNSFVFEFEFIKLALRNNIEVFTIDVSPRTDIVFSNFRIKTIYKESLNLLKIMIKRNGK